MAKQKDVFLKVEGNACIARNIHARYLTKFGCAESVIDAVSLVGGSDPERARLPELKIKCGKVGPCNGEQINRTLMSSTSILRTRLVEESFLF